GCAAECARGRLRRGAAGFGVGVLHWERARSSAAHRRRPQIRRVVLVWVRSRHTTHSARVFRGAAAFFAPVAFRVVARLGAALRAVDFLVGLGFLLPKPNMVVAFPV
ncbi:hypothetical protein ABZ342_32020, partial [Amycolatopsis sp. NPDC005961]|uniref:hypothetical protein n=1 Tax=Amycolatopsis sp. NPDC005961 TaxID=3156720 RepID=UPI0033FF9F97